jgi:hypothetical protein
MLEIIKNPLDKDPKKANVVVSGIAKDEGRKQFLIVERKWTNSGDKIEILNTGPDLYEHIAKNGKRYFIYMIERNDHHIIEQNVRDLESTGNLIKIFSGKKDFPGEINPSWQYCESDKECTQTKNKCEKSIAVNRRYKNVFLDFLKTSERKWNCSKKEEAKVIGKCVENYCS